MTVWQSIVAAIKSGAWVGVAGTAIGLGVTVGLLTQSQANADTTAVTAIGAAIVAIMAATHTLHAATLIRRNERLVLSTTRPARPTD